MAAKAIVNALGVGNHHGSVELAAEHQVAKRRHGRLVKLELDSGVLGTLREEPCEPKRADARQDAEPERLLLLIQMPLGGCLDAIGLGLNFLEHRACQLAELGEMRATPLAPDQQSAEFSLELLDGARERGLRDVTPFRGTRKVQRLAQCKKISDLIKLHCVPPLLDPVKSLTCWVTCHSPTSIWCDPTSPSLRDAISCRTRRFSDAVEQAPRFRASPSSKASGNEQSTCASPLPGRSCRAVSLPLSTRGGLDSLDRTPA